MHSLYAGSFSSSSLVVGSGDFANMYSVQVIVAAGKQRHV